MKPTSTATSAQRRRRSVNRVSPGVYVLLSVMVLLSVFPLYWMFVGFVATCSFFRGTKQWGKTERLK